MRKTVDADSVARPGSVWRWALAACALTLVLLWPAWYNGQPLLFPDSVGYERAGAVSLAATHVVAEPGVKPTARSSNATGHVGDKVSTARSPYYGIPLTLVLDAGGVWAVATLQALAVATALLLAMRRLRISLPLATGTIVVLALAGGLAVYAEALMPDVFVGLMVLGFAMLLAVPDLPRTERLIWLVAVIAAMLFHQAFLAIGILMTIGAAVLARRLRLERLTIMLLGGCCLIGTGGHMLVGLTIRHTTGQPPLSVPFVLARYADSPVLGDYLRDSCSPPRFVICRYRDRLPMAPDEFLWGGHGLYAAVSNLSDRRAIATQADAVLRGAITARPVDAVVEAMRGGIVQLFTVGMDDFALGIPATTVIDARLAPAMAVYPDSAIAHRTFPLDRLRTLAVVLYLTGAAAIIAVLITARERLPHPDRNDRQRIKLLLAVLVGGAVTNAMVSGMLSGVFERYQGRIAWLLPFGAVILWQAQRRREDAAALA